ncbi:PaaI family thioesterase [Paenochrobactrum sp. BZR 588]|uniref:PaaI family thioesterase n=1 Tax=Paenochrobactrum TaxID=999488 RepID=UPI0035BBC3B1
MSVEELEGFLSREFPQLHETGRDYHVSSIKEGTAIMTLNAGAKHLRPGNTVSGPSLFMLADVSAYAVILAHIGPVALAVTTNLNINFLRKAEAGLLTAEARLLKLGKRLAVVDIFITDSNDALIAHATTTYSVPLNR